MKSVAFVPTDARLGAGPGKMELREVPDPAPAVGELVVKVSHCGILRSRC